MEMIDIFGLQFVLSLVVYAMLGLWVAQPWLRRQSVHDAVFWLSVPHAFRHLGLVFLVPGVVAPTMPSYFDSAAAYGDLAAGILAIATLVAARQRWGITIALAWLLTVVGLVDLGNALRHVEVLPHFQSAWYIPTFVVPLLLVTHFMTIGHLLRQPFGSAKLAEPTA